MAIYTLPLSEEGAVTAPSGTLALTVPSAESVTYLDVGPVSVLELPDFGWAIADGVNPLRLITRGAVYNAGLIAASTAPVAAVGARATVVLTLAAVPTNGDTMTLRGFGGGLLVTFKTTLDPSDLGIGESSAQVLIGTIDETLAYIMALINGTAGQGTTYYNGGQYNGVSPYLYATTEGIEVSAIDTGANTATFRAVSGGTGGNAFTSTETFADAGNVFASAAFTGGANGTTGEPGAGSRRWFFTSYRDADGAESGPSEIVTYAALADTNVSLSSLTANADTTADYTRVYRTALTGVEFFLVKAIARSGTTATDDVSDDDIARGVPYNATLFRSHAEGLPPRGLALAFWKGRLWTGGCRAHAEYATGTASVTVGSASVTISVLGVTSLMVGRTFQVASTSEEYTILAVDEATRVLTLDRAYTGSTNGTATYTIRDAYDARRMHASIEFLYNQFPVDESPGSIETDDTAGLSAYLATRSRLFAFSRTTTSSVTGDGIESWEVSKIADGVGCVGQRLVVPVEGGGIFLAQDGFYAIGPNGEMSCISSPKGRVGSVARGIDGTVARIAWASVDQGYSEYDQENRLVTFGVPLDGAAVPNYEIVFDLQNSTWALYKRAEWTAMARIVLPGGGVAILAGDREGRLWQVGVGESDGAYGFEAVQTLSGAQTVRTLTTDATELPTTGDALKGVPVIVLYAAGTTVAYGKVASNTNAAITLAEDLETAPAAGDQIIVGGIGWVAKSGFTTFGEEYTRKILRDVTIRHATATRGAYFLSYAVDGGSFSLPPVGTGIGALIEADGKVTHAVQYPGDTHAIQLRGFKPGGRAVIRGGVFSLAVRQEGGR